MKFVKKVQEAGLFVHLRIGPYACAEWNYGLVPYMAFSFLLDRLISQNAADTCSIENVWDNQYLDTLR